MASTLRWIAEPSYDDNTCADRLLADMLMSLPLIYLLAPLTVMLVPAVGTGEDFAPSIHVRTRRCMFIRLTCLRAVKAWALLAAISDVHIR